MCSDRRQAASARETARSTTSSGSRAAPRSQRASWSASPARRAFASPAARRDPMTAVAAPASRTVPGRADRVTMRRAEAAGRSARRPVRSRPWRRRPSTGLSGLAAILRCGRRVAREPQGGKLRGGSTCNRGIASPRRYNGGPAARDWFDSVTSAFVEYPECQNRVRTWVRQFTMSRRGFGRPSAPPVSRHSFTWRRPGPRWMLPDRSSRLTAGIFPCW